MAMKWIGLLAALALAVACFFPWVYIESKDILVSGVDSTGTNFGRPGYFHLVLVGFFVIFDMAPRLWAKRANLLVAALNIAWAARNYFIITACSGGECPVKKTALWIVLASSALMMAAALTPKLPVRAD